MWFLSDEGASVFSVECISYKNSKKQEPDSLSPNTKVVCCVSCSRVDSFRNGFLLGVSPSCLQVGPPSLSHSCVTASLLASQGLLLFPLNLALLTRYDQWDTGFVMLAACSPVSPSWLSANQEKRSQLDFSHDEEGRGEGRPSSWQPSPRCGSQSGVTLGCWEEPSLNCELTKLVLLGHCALECFVMQY